MYQMVDAQFLSFYCTNSLTHKFDKVYKESKPILPFKNLNKETDKKLCKAMLSAYFKEVAKEARPQHLDSLFTAFNGNSDSIAEYLYNNSSFITLIFSL